MKAWIPLQECWWEICGKDGKGAAGVQLPDGRLLFAEGGTFASYSSAEALQKEHPGAKVFFLNADGVVNAVEDAI